ncbi:MAG TPA: tRNA 2-thiouridine(34) synthase MnmA [Gemmatimonadales bacterium]|nr:tRNA 2-thiouridine(34) synthase MnmA [Gemmatimonadales bacterium]
MRVLVALSGGVDSSVAAALMVEEGHEVVAATLKQWDGPTTAGCCTVGDATDARRAAGALGIRHYVLDYVERFTTAVVDRFGSEYLAGRTPNPCIDCNRTVRFGALLSQAEDLGCDVLVTGHHARVRQDGAGRHLLRAVDATKDQSYVLYMLGQEELSRVRFPVGEMTKAEVRELAAGLGLGTASKPDSQDLCFAAGDYRAFLRRRVAELDTAGPIVDTGGTVVGSHDGVAGFTIGQRRGLGIAAGEPRYVVSLHPATATIVVGNADDLLADGCRVTGMTFVAGRPPADGGLSVKVRYRSEPVAAALSQTGPGEWLVSFAEPVAAVAPGQAAVLYRGDEVLGGGTISAALGGSR